MCITIIVRSRSLYFVEVIIVSFALTQRDGLNQTNYATVKQKDFNIILCRTSFSMTAAKNLGSCAQATRYLFADSSFSLSLSSSI